MNDREIEALTANSHIGIGKCTLDGRLLFLTESGLQILGCTMQELQAAFSDGSFGVELIYPEDRPDYLAALERLKAHPLLSIPYECRLNRPGKEPSWVTLDAKCDMEGEEPVIICFVSDVTRIEQANIQILKQKELLEKERRRFQIAVDSTPVAVFEYDLAEDFYLCYGTLEVGEHKHNLESHIPHMLESHLGELVEEPYLELFHEALVGNVREAELRTVLYPGSETYVWAKLTVTPMFDEAGGVTRTIGKFSNIQSEKEKEFTLLEAHSVDALTGLYAREPGLFLVKEYLRQKDSAESCGMMLIDMDDFERLGEEEGSVFADGILQEVADILRAEAGEDGIGIRLGGDEFMLFVKNCRKSRATVLGPRIAERIRSLFSVEDPALRVSASIGMCVTEVAEDYDSLYHCAESTLAYVKENGKGRAACYLDTSNELGITLTKLYTKEMTINAIDRAATWQSDLVSFALELLGKARNLDDAIFLLLSRLGNAGKYDRVSILELDREYMSCRFTFQWARSPSDLLLGQAFYFNREQFEGIPALYGEDGLSEQPVGGGLAMLSSCLHAAIWDHGSYAGALIFECAGDGRAWSGEERKTLLELTKIVSSFLLKARADAVSQAKTDFLSRMSHEIRTPMNAISGMTTIAKTVLDDRARTLDCLNKIESANSYLLMLINDILDMSRIESGKMEIHRESVDLDRLIGDLDAMLRPSAEQKYLRFTVENGYRKPRPLLADSLHLNQVLVNIIGNAIKFTPAGGTVTLRIEKQDLPGRSVILRFSVKDTGIGIHKENLSRIFNAFEQAERDTSASYGGTGLGLSISSRLVQMMGSTLEVESEPGVGSTFWFEMEFPFAERAPAPAVAKSAGLVRKEELAGKRLLLAEDNALNQEIAQTILEMNGFVVETAVNGKEAVERFAQRKAGYYSAILMDIRMPVMDGLEATRKIRTLGQADSRTVPIIAMTANAFDEDSKKSIESGMNGHLTKPIQVDTLLALLGECLGAQ